MHMSKPRFTILHKSYVHLPLVEEEKNYNCNLMCRSVSKRNNSLNNPLKMWEYWGDPTHGYIILDQSEVNWISIRYNTPQSPTKRITWN